LNALGGLLAREETVAVATNLLAIDPLHEPAHRALMRLHAAQGRRASALRQYQTCVEALRHQLGVEPEAASRQLYETILREPAGVAPSPSRHETVVEDDAAPFVGRARETVAMRSAIAAALAGRGHVMA